MKHIVEFPTEDGNSVLMEVDEPETEGVVRVSRRGEVAETAAKTFEESLDGIRPAASAIIQKLRDLSVPPDQLGVEFGLKFSAKAGAIFASVDAEANVKVTLTWKGQG